MLTIKRGVFSRLQARRGGVGSTCGGAGRACWISPASYLHYHNSWFGHFLFVWSFSQFEDLDAKIINILFSVFLTENR